ncbi:MAG: acyltransferase [Candidatus Cryptobacteroides sp.]
MDYSEMIGSREIWIDRVRLMACFLVMLTHSCEPFYLGGEGALILTHADAWWVAILDSLPRACVALFVIASSYLQFPLHYSTGEFFRRRLVRVGIPFLIWTLVYALVWGEPVQNFKDLMLNFNYAAGHLWFVYMLAGLYIIMPLLSPWAEKVQKKELTIYLAIWFFTTFIPLIRQLAGGPAPVIYGPSGIPNPARFPLWGEASWNAYGAFYYMSGFIGYMLLGLYFRKFVGELSWVRTLLTAVPLFIAGFVLCCGGFLSNVMADAKGVFPVEGPVGMAALWECFWLNDSLGVALMAVAWILVFKQFNCRTAIFDKVILPVSKASYGMYLCHLLILGSVSSWLRSSLGLGTEGMLGPVWTTPVQILGTSLISFLSTAIICTLLRRIPRLGPALIG